MRVAALAVAVDTPCPAREHVPIAVGARWQASRVKPVSSRCLFAVAIALGVVWGASHADAAATVSVSDFPAYLDVLDMHGMPKGSSDRSFNIFFDAGSWHGYSLPPEGDATTGFVGPFVHSLHDGRWVGRRFAVLSLHDAGSGRAITLHPVASHAAPGYLDRRFAAPGLGVRETLFFADFRHALVRIEVSSENARSIRVSVRGELLQSLQEQLSTGHGEVVQTFTGFASELVTCLHVDGGGAGRAEVSGRGYRIALQDPLRLQPHRTARVYVEQALVPVAVGAALPPVDGASAWLRNRQRWNGYLKTAASSHLAGVPDAVARRVAVKAIETLIGNWRAPRGDLHHAGVIPSYSNPDFNGFWAWDSWKQAAALALFAPKLAREQILAMFDYQAANGMVPDCVFADKANDNWRDSKPPLATWAVLKVHDATGDRAFLAAMYPKLVRYHRWWFADRDHDHDGLAEYGSTDGSTLAAKWESGMDNAVRFDRIHMLRNGPHAWSMDQESVDLNAYLYAEARELARIAGILGKMQDRAEWLAQAAELERAVQARMFDAKAGWFFDVKLAGGFAHVYGPEGWIPLWTGVATPAQARAVAKVMLDPGKFDTLMPLPSLARDDPRFSPVRGYWRGPVWLDQALFGIEGLQRYGYAKQADALARKLVDNAVGLAGQAPVYENYDPLTGHGYQSRNFSWSAASYLLLLHDGIGDEPVSTGSGRKVH